MKQEEGFALAVLIIFIAALSIMMAATAPSYKMQVQRELEEELIFRGEVEDLEFGRRQRLPLIVE